MACKDAGATRLVAKHLAEYVAGEDDAVVFTGAKGDPVRRSNFQKH